MNGDGWGSSPVSVIFSSCLQTQEDKTKLVILFFCFHLQSWGPEISFFSLFLRKWKLRAHLHIQWPSPPRLTGAGSCGLHYRPKSSCAGSTLKLWLEFWSLGSGVSFIVQGPAWAATSTQLFLVWSTRPAFPSLSTQSWRHTAVSCIDMPLVCRFWVCCLGQSRLALAHGPGVWHLKACIENSLSCVPLYDTGIYNWFKNNKELA